jgi:hypothetical protein
MSLVFILTGVESQQPPTAHNQQTNEQRNDKAFAENPRKNILCS